MGKRRRWLWWLVLGAALVAVIVTGMVLGLAVNKHRETGKWEVPDVNDLIKVVVPDGPAPPSKIIFLDRKPATLTPGDDYAARGVSGVVRYNHPGGPVKMPGWKGSEAAWKKLVACVRTQFAPFDVEVTDQPPASDDYIRVAVGGRPKDLGVKERNVTGLAPFNGQVIPRAVVFAFAAQQKNDPRAICETIAMEVAHAYGLDHEYLCKDVMTYLSGCGTRSFVDKDARCGEKKERDCQGGGKTQNSYRRMIGVLGASTTAR